ncbi:MAG: CUB domain-containing protein, partial [Bacteroidia bacterium]|nr:CUB domain-containing protein [Bacteroidia bacterium]
MITNIKNTSLLLFLLNSFFVFSQNFNITDGQTINTCTGNFYDSGGAGANYTNGETITYTICPNNSSASEVIQVNFTAFSTQGGGADFLTIYDGDSTAGSLLGVFDGSNSPGTVNATTASGCLTFEWVSNGAVAFPGWEAEILCFQPCQIITAVLD